MDEHGVDRSAVPCKIWTCVFVPGGHDEQAGWQGDMAMAGLASCVYVHSADRKT